MDTANHSDALLEEMEIQERLFKIKHKIVVMSGKGGVGKSSVAANLATSLALAGKKVGLLDIDIHGPSIPKILGLEGKTLTSENNLLIPLEIGNLKVLSIGFMLNHADDAVIWRGPMKYTAIKQFIKDVNWGELDYLIIDSPPGTGDEPLSIIQILGKADGAIIVTTPQSLSLIDVRKSITFCNRLNLPILGIVENMSGFVCPHCQKTIDIFKNGGGEKMAQELNIPFLGKLPIDPLMVEAADEGKIFVYFYSQTATAREFQKIVDPILQLSDSTPGE